MGAIPRRMPSANHKDEAIYEAIHKAFHLEHSTSANHIAEEETQSEDSFAI